MNTHEIMKNDIANIPSELLMEIVGHLLPEEKAAGLLICKSWFEVFRHGLYNNICLKNISQLQWLLDSLAFSKNSSDGHLNGNLIKRLYIHDSKFSISYLQNKGMHCKIAESLFKLLPDVCPNLQCLDFDSHIWEKVVYHSNIEKWGKIRHLPAFPNLDLSLPYLQQFGDHLTSLSIRGELLVTRSTQSALISALSMAPRITHLTMKGSKNSPHSTFTPQTIDTIHTLLPRLESLEIAGDLMLTAKDLDQVRKFPTVSSAFTSLHLNTPLFTTAWAYYITCRYPQLRCLTLILDGSPQTENSLLFLAEQCHQLEVITLSCSHVSHWLNRSFLETLKRNNPQLRQISPVVKRANQLMYDSDITLALACGKELLTALEIQQWRFNAKLHSTVNSLSNFSKLTYLNLVCDTYHSEYEMGRLLDNCPLLETLVLEWGTLLVPPQENWSHLPTMWQHPLKTLSITLIAFSPCAFKYLSKRCQSLTNLYIHKCKQLCTPNDFATRTELLIDMPYNRFQTILIDGVQLDQPYIPMPNTHGISMYIKLASIQTCKETNWYHHVGYDCSDRSYPILNQLKEEYDMVVEYFIACRRIGSKEKQKIMLSRMADKLGTSLACGYVMIHCKAIENFSLDSHITHY